MTQRLRAFVLFFLLPTSLAMSACNCAGNEPSPPPGACTAANDGATCEGGICCGSTCQGASGTCPPGQECNPDLVCSAEATVDCNCIPLPPLGRGRMADDLDSTIQADDTVVLAGYSPGDPSRVPNGKYGDLVIGSYDGAEVTWEIIDGVPATGNIGGAIDGWRDGKTTPGDNVGRYPSIEAIGNDLVVAYADLTNGSLKAAARVEGEWSIFEVDADAGESVSWTSMALDPDGLPIVSYLVVNKPDATLEQTQPQSSLRIARPATPLPVGSTWEWTHYEIDSGEMRCGANLCGTGYQCLVADNGTCAIPTTDCVPGCTNNTVCYNAACYENKAAEDYVIAEGLFTDIEATAGGFGLVYYDRTTRSLYGRSCSAPCEEGSWTAPMLIDGPGSPRTGAGDCGIGASLFVDADDTWHVSYVDGTSEALWYARLPSGAAPNANSY
ncbi:MAG: hypothetical protein H5U40_06750, partial [Polyangiaceae bacterium]|nr:hypothetical protein [Polyangiaceae bacterium]